MADRRGELSWSSTAASGRAATPCGLGAATSADLAKRGWAAWNIEYRRLGNGGGWPATFADVAAAVDHLS